MPPQTDAIPLEITTLFPTEQLNMSSNTSQSDAKILADRLASLEVTEDQANTKSSADGAARPSEDGERVLDPELWKPHPPTEDCPVCFVPLPLDQAEFSYWVCCGKIICPACSWETARAELVINAKRAEKKQPPLDHACSFCRLAADASEPCLLYTSPSPRDKRQSRMPSSA